MPEQYLAHFGVPGMKWGVRKAESSKGTGRKKRGMSPETKAKLKKAASIGVLAGSVALGVRSGKRTYKRGSALERKGQAMQKLAVAADLHNKKVYSSRAGKRSLEEFMGEANRVIKSNNDMQKVFNKGSRTALAGSLTKLSAVPMGASTANFYAGVGNAAIKRIFK